MEEEADYDEQMVEDETDSDSSMEEDEDSIKIGARELQQTLLEEEKKGTQMKEIKELWQLAQPIIDSSEEGISLFTTYIYLLRRLGASIDEMKAAFLEGKQMLSNLFGEYWDENAKFRQNFAYFLYTKAKQPDEALTLWKDILASGFDSDPYQWIEAARMERHFGSVENARTLLYKGITAHLSEPYDFFQYFLQFEREEGTRDQVDLALEKINAASSRQQQQRQPRHNQRNDNHQRDRNNQRDRNKKQDRNQRQNDRPQKRKADQSPEKFRKSNDEPKAEKNGNPPPAKLIKDSEGFAIPMLPVKKQENKNGSTTPTETPSTNSTVHPPHPEPSEKSIFLSNIPFSWNGDDVRKQFPAAVDVRIPHKTKDQNKGYAFVDFGNVEDANAALKLNGHLQVDGRDIQIFPSKNHEGEDKPAFRYGTGQEKNKLFVRNVNFKSTEEDLRKFFAQFGEVKEVRIVHHKNGKPKGVAYVEFFDEKDATKGLAANQQDFNGRQLEVHISDPSVSNRSRNAPENAKKFEPKNALGSGQVKKTSGFSLTPRILLKK